MFTEYLSIALPNYFGMGIGFLAMGIIALWHPIVIKGEYYFGKWPCIGAFLLSAVVTIYASLRMQNLFYSTLAAFWGIVSLWSVVEIPLQQKRVQKGYFPKRSKH